ncbi:MAG TPA: hypothetical protein VD948_12385 [Rhodothermales bacterium]|nr:hypothetical protein [Rhodothermales bacterium]
MLGLSLIDWGVLALYIAGITVVGLRATRAMRSSGDYFMGGRRFGRVLMIAQAFGTGTRTDQAVAVMGAAAQVGLAGIWYQWLYLFSTPFFWLIAPLYRRMRYITIGDFFEKRFGTKMGAAYAFVGLLYFTLESGIILRAAGVTIEAITGGAVPSTVAVLAVMAFFVAYGLLGGLVAAATTQFVQGLFILVLSFLLIPFAIDAAGGIEGIRQAVSPERFSLVAGTEVTGFFIVMSILNAFVGIVVIPHHMAINGSGKDEIACRTGWTYGTFLKRLATLGWAFTGIFLAVLFPALSTATGGEREQALGMAVRELLPAGLVGLMVAAMIAGCVAAANAYMVNGSALFTRNFYLRYYKPHASERETLWSARLSGLAVVVLGVVFALVIPSVIEGLVLIWKITAFLGIAFWVAIAWRRANRYGAVASVAVAATLSFVTDAMGWSFPAQIALYLPAGFLTMILVSRFTRPEPEDRLNEFYSLLNTPVGEEERLEKAGITTIHEAEQGDPAATLPPEHERPPIPLLDDAPAAARGESLMLANLLRLHRGFSVARYRVDLKGFGIGWVLVFGFLALAMVLARLVST